MNYGWYFIEYDCTSMQTYSSIEVQRLHQRWQMCITADSYAQLILIITSLPGPRDSLFQTEKSRPDLKLLSNLQFPELKRTHLFRLVRKFQHSHYDSTRIISSSL